MKNRYLLLVASIVFVGHIYSAGSNKSQNEKSVRGELHMLLEKKDPSGLSLGEVRRVRHIMNEFKKFDKKGAALLTDKFIRPEDQCCFELGAFERREIDLELNNLFNNPKPKDGGWNNQVKKFLDVLYHAAYNSGCGTTDEDGNEFSIVKQFEHYKNRYEKISGHTYKK